MARRHHIHLSSARPATLRAAARADTDYGHSDTPDWRRVPWRTHLRAVTIEGRRIHVVDIGAGAATPVLFVHGLGGRWQNWLENIPRLAATRRVVALDLPGFGRSQTPREPITIPGYAAALDALCDRLELDRVVLVGNSMGGFIAVEMALRFAARIERIALVSAAAVSIADYNPLPASALLGVLARTPLGSDAGARALLARPRTRHLAFAPIVRHPTLLARDALCEMTVGRGADGFPGALRAMINHDVRGEVAQIEVPAMIVHGRDDVLVPVRDSMWLADRLPRARLEVFEDTGHLPMLERPIRFNNALLRFTGP
jgi:pimeloyl-ACP methyl ester carboxylesterase